MKTTFRGLAVGDVITVREPVKCHYFGYPYPGDNNVVFNHGELASIGNFPPYVTGRNTYFVRFDAKGKKFGTNRENIIKKPKTHEAKIFRKGSGYEVVYKLENWEFSHGKRIHYGPVTEERMQLIEYTEKLVGSVFCMESYWPILAEKLKLKTLSMGGWNGQSQL